MICGHCCLTVRSLVVVTWVLWQAAAPMVPNAPPEGAAVLQSFEVEEECVKKAARSRMERNVIVRNGQPQIPVWVCLPPAPTRREPTSSEPGGDDEQSAIRGAS